MAGLESDVHGHVVMALRPSNRVQNVAIGAASTSSTVFQVEQQNTQLQDRGTVSGAPGPSGTTHIRLVSTVDCYIQFGTAPVVSSTTGTFLPASSPEYFPVLANDVVAVIQSTAAGNLNITECT